MLARTLPSRILFAIVLGCGLILLFFSSYPKPYQYYNPIETEALDTPLSLLPTNVTVSSINDPEPSSVLSAASVKTSDSPANNRCNALKNSDDILVVLKTGANEVFEKLPTQLLTMLQCVEDLLIFSDLEQELGAYHIYDALDSVTEAVKLNNPDFDYYRTLHEYKRIGQDISTLRDTAGKAAWNLDKYKFMPMLEKSWQKKPHKRWYVFIEADTYLIWTNLLLWLERLDPKELIYLGSPTFINNEQFGHGGSGVILSGAAMEKVFGGGPGVAAQYDLKAKDEMLGDHLLMLALKEHGVKFRTGWPLLQAEKPSTIPFGRGPNNGVRHWCQPIVTMHHVTAREASIIRQYELERPDPMKPFLLEEMYHHVTKLNIAIERENWFNLSDDLEFKAPGVEGGRQKPLEELTDAEKEAHKSFEHCRTACEQHHRCYQFVFYDDTCGFSYSYRLGEKRKPQHGKAFKSGWDLKKIAKDQEEHPCTAPEWI